MQILSINCMKKEMKIITLNEQLIADLNEISNIKEKVKKLKHFGPVKTTKNIIEFLINT